MIAFLSASIEMAVRGFANALLAIFPFLPSQRQSAVVLIAFWGESTDCGNGVLCTVDG